MGQRCWLSESTRILKPPDMEWQVKLSFKDQGFQGMCEND